jgi:Cu(I)/Ag(I) efflux system membrane fusion protein
MNTNQAKFILKSAAAYARRAGVFALIAAFSAFGPGCEKKQEGERKIKFYQSPMHPWITSDKPGNCTICGMALTPVYEGESGAFQAEGMISLGTNSVSVLDVATMKAARGPLLKTMRFSGVLEDDENLRRVVAAFYDGRIDGVFVEHNGKFVRKGEPLAAIYSPELLYVVRDLQNSTRTGEKAAAANAAQRLIQYGLSKDQVDALAQQQGNVYTINLLSPISGNVLVKKAYKGQYIKTGEPLFEISDLSHMWFHAEVYERDLPDLRVGQKVTVRTPSVPGREFPGIVTFIDPRFDLQTRSTKVRVEVPNPLVQDYEADGMMRRVLSYGAFAEAEVEGGISDALVVPRSALLQDGRRSVLYVEKGPGNYEQRNVKAGRVGNDHVEILEGLDAGEKVVVQGNLMIDAEAQLRNGIEMEGMEKGAKPPESIETFLKQLARASDALANDNLAAAVEAGQTLPQLSAMLELPGNPAADAAVTKLHAMKDAPAGADLQAIRKTFLPWSAAGAELAMAMKSNGMDTGVSVLECPMTSSSFPGAPSKAQWVQAGAKTRNPYLGAEMLDCGAEVKP